MPVHSPLLQPNACRATARIASTLVALALFSACATDKPDPTGLNPSARSSNGVPLSVGLASPAWQARSLALAVPLGPVPSGHAIPQVAVAQYLALQQAEAALDDPGGRALLETDRGAVAGASAVVLSALFPTQAQSFEDLVTAQANTGPGQPHPAFRAAEAIGREVGRAIVTRMNADGFTNVITPPMPRPYDGFWVPSPGASSLPAGATLPGTTRWFPLAFAGQFRPGPPPAPGTGDFNTALAEIRDYSDHRTQAMIDLAALWAPRASGYWVGVASEQIAQRGFSEREATHLYALLSATVADAMISCWDAKLTYWLIRPWDADTHITTTAAVGKPNHPSYPSGHSCVSASAADVLSSFFPDMAAQLASNVHDAGFSRMVSGLHYGFDVSAGQGIGHNVAAFTIAADRSGNSVLTAH